MSRMIQFEYSGVRREALEIGIDDRHNGCLFCFQVTKDGEIDLGHRSFKVHKMMDVIEIDRAPFEAQLGDIDDTGFKGENGGGYGLCVDCGIADQLNCDQKCSGCETAVVVFQS